MDHESLRTASTYLNNLLLARGLLRNSEPIDFVKPSKDSRAQIINLVHDLVLREDRSRDQQEHAAVTLRQLRAADARHAAETQRSRERHEEAARAAEQARAAERAAYADVKKVEKALKAVQEQAARLRAGLAQVKAQCVADVKKRELELARLKTHLQGQQRGTRVGLAPPSITITPGTKGKAAAAPPQKAGQGLDDPEYSLRQETTEFLTQLGQSLSDENDGLINLIRGALGTLKDLLGLPSARRHPDSAVGSMGSEGERKQEGVMLQALPTAYDTLAADMEDALAHLKAILSNPNFVAIEEVEVRDEEIRRLRAGWEHMERRWKDVFVMFEGWQHRMNDGETINIEDLRRGMGLVSPSRPTMDLIRVDPEQSFADSEVSEIQLPQDDVTEGSIPELAPPSSPATGRSSPKRKRNVLDPPDSFDLRPGAGKAACLPPAESDVEAEGEEDSHDEQGELTVAQKLSAAQAEAEDAAAARAIIRREITGQADSTVKGSGERDSGSSSSIGPRRGRITLGGSRGTGEKEEEQEDRLGRMASPVKRTKIKGRPRRRKSTLCPEELEALMRSVEEEEEEEE
nr:hypothetical protein CFP56_07824 [Quercus suber]